MHAQNEGSTPKLHSRLYITIFFKQHASLATHTFLTMQQVASWLYNGSTPGCMKAPLQAVHNKILSSMHLSYIYPSYYAAGSKLDGLVGDPVLLVKSGKKWIKCMHKMKAPLPG